MTGLVRISAIWIACGLATSAVAQQPAAVAPDPAVVRALVAAMEPGEQQQKLEFLVGTFDLKIRTWIDPAQPPVESMGVAISNWVLGGRYIQTMISGFIAGEPFNAIGYAGFDNVAKHYVATYMDSGSTGMEWYTGTMDADGKLGKMTTTIHDAVTLEPTRVEMRIQNTANGDHTTELWQADRTGKMIRVIELQYTRRKS